MSEEIIKKTQKEISHEYYINNKEKLQDNYKKRIQCPLCLKDVCKGALNSHLKTKNCERRSKIRQQQILIEAPLIVKTA